MKSDRILILFWNQIKAVGTCNADGFYRLIAAKLYAKIICLPSREKVPVDRLKDRR